MKLPKRLGYKFLSSTHGATKRCFSLSSSHSRFEGNEKKAKPRKTDLKKFDAKIVEKKWYSWWESMKMFSDRNFLDDEGCELNPSTSKEIGGEESEGDEDRPVILALPPPNVTGSLHMGHALTVTLMDAIARWKRMKGHTVVWVPGFDHAGIATQSMVAKMLKEETGKEMESIPRSTFINECKRWKNTRVKEITSQLKRIGASLDFDRTYYTKDRNFSAAVKEAFRILYEKELIFRDRRLVNWSPFLQSTLSDQEVSLESVKPHEEISVPGRKEKVTLGRIYIVDYLDSTDPSLKIRVATTRPETIFADVAIAVHPEDERYAGMVGRRFRNPLVPDCLLPVITSESVVRDFGTGALKITPAHDFTDWRIGKENDLPLNTVCIDDRGKIVNAPQDFLGLDRFDARTAVVSFLESTENTVEVIGRESLIPKCQRSGDIIEPSLKEQWFIKCREMAASVRELAESDQITFDPEHFKAEWISWHSKTEDWCISRQLLWGHPIPAFYNQEKDQWVIASTATEADALTRKKRKPRDPSERPTNVVARKSVSSETLKHQTNNTKPKKKTGREGWKQDSDVLDTWFSSALVPLVIAGWPEYFAGNEYPLDMLVTGQDILAFWVSRMAMLCGVLAPEDNPRVPFPKVVLHGIVRDGHGEKMSKSKGNVIDPMELIEGNPAANLPGYGADSLRFALLKFDVKVKEGLQIASVEQFGISDSSKICDKIWNSFLFCEKFWSFHPPSKVRFGHPKNFRTEKFCGVDIWIISRLRGMIEATDAAMTDIELHRARAALVDFWVKDFCDLYLEFAKPFLREDVENTEKAEIVGEILACCTSSFLRVLAPFMPFLTEELWARLDSYRTNEERQSSIHLTLTPAPGDFFPRNPDIEAAIDCCRRIVEEIRSIRSRFQLGAKDFPLQVCLKTTPEVADSVHLFESLFESLVNVTFSLVVTEPESGKVEEWLEKGAVESFVDLQTSLLYYIPAEKRKDYCERLESQVETRTRKMEKIKQKKLQLEERIPSVQDHSHRAKLRSDVKGLEGQGVKIEKEIEGLQKILDGFNQ